MFNKIYSLTIRDPIKIAICKNLHMLKYVLNLYITNIIKPQSNSSVIFRAFTTILFCCSIVFLSLLCQRKKNQLIVLLLAFTFYNLETNIIESIVVEIGGNEYHHMFGLLKIIISLLLAYIANCFFNVFIYISAYIFYCLIVFILLNKDEDNSISIQRLFEKFPYIAMISTILFYFIFRNILVFFLFTVIESILLLSVIEISSNKNFGISDLIDASNEFNSIKDDTVDFLIAVTIIRIIVIKIITVIIRKIKKRRNKC